MKDSTPQSILSTINKISPYPQCYSIDQAKPGKEKLVREALAGLSSLGLVKLHNQARCGFEIVKGEYATLTPRGLQLARSI